MNFLKKGLKKIKLFILYWTRIVFVRNNFKVSFFNKARMNILGGFLADQYVLYDLKHNNKKEYLSEFDWYRSRYINEPFDFAFNNKVICNEILKQYIRTPVNYFLKNRSIILRFDGGPVDEREILRSLKKKKKLFIKPIALGKGNGVHLLKFEEDNIYIDENMYSSETFIKFLHTNQDYIICEYMQQHSYAASLYNKTVNTIRLITIRDIETHEFKIYFAIQRIGRKETIPVDNGSKGGLVSKINLETGILSEARCLYDLKEYLVHPDSGNKIRDIKIPEWKKVKTEILKVCRKLPYMDFIAWDILIMEEGFCVIEANTSSGVNILQLWEGQRHKELGRFFKHYKII